MQQNTKINTLVPLFLVVKLESGNNLAKTWLFRTKFGINLALLAKKFGFEKEKMLQKKSGNTVSWRMPRASWSWLIILPCSFIILTTCVCSVLHAQN